MRVGPFQIQVRAPAQPLTIADWQARATRRVPPMVMAYVENGSEDAQTLAWNRDAYLEWRLRQRVLAGSAEVDLRTRIAGVDLDLPVLLAPTGLTGSVHWTGELGAARAAERCGTRLVMSTGSSYSIEEVGRGTTEDHWFQLYPWGDRELTGSLVRRARDAGFSALFLTVDVPVVGNRLDEQRRGMGIPPVITPVRALQAGLHPRWAYGLARHRRITLRNLAEPGTRGTVLGTVRRQALNMRPDLNWDDLAWLRQQWHGPLFVKGVLDPDDAERAADAGADGVVVSNHGGRQLNGTLATVEALPDVAARVGDRVEVLVDGGVRSGADVLKALALGARGVLLGRPQLYGLGGGGEEGVVSVLSILAAEMRRNLTLMGLPGTRALDGSALVRAGA